MNDVASNPDLPPTPDPLAVVLSKLEPRPAAFNRDSLMFAAGQTSKLNALMFWRVAAAVGFVAAGVFATLYFTRPTQIQFPDHQVIGEPTKK
ncbi:MAG: hypothetical protein U0792_06425 [Gemmataceae bacterium]